MGTIAGTIFSSIMHYIRKGGMAVVGTVKNSQNTKTRGGTIELRLAGYEALAWKVINGHGYPNSWDELCEEFDNDASHPDAVKVANAILFHTQAVRDYIRSGDAEAAAFEALLLEHQATKLMYDIALWPNIFEGAAGLSALA